MYGNENATADCAKAEVPWDRRPVIVDHAAHGAGLLRTSVPIPEPTSILDSEIERLQDAGRDQDRVISDLERFADRLLGRQPEAIDPNSCSNDAVSMPPVSIRLNRVSTEAYQRAARLERVFERLSVAA